MSTKVKTKPFWKAMIVLSLGEVVLWFTKVYPSGTIWMHSHPGLMLFNVTWVIMLAGSFWYAPWRRNRKTGKSGAQ